MATPNLELPEVPQAIQNASGPLNEGFLRLDAIVHLAVLDKDLTVDDLPEDAVQGDRYIIASGMRAKHIAFREPTGWKFYVPRPGWRARVLDEDVWYQFDGTQWVTDAIDASTIGYDNDSSGLVAENLQDAIDELAGRGIAGPDFFDWATECFSAPGTSSPIDGLYLETTGTASITQTDAEANHPGVWRLSASGSGGICSAWHSANTQSDELVLSANPIVLDAILKVEDLPTESIDFTFQVGLSSETGNTINDRIHAAINRAAGGDPCWSLVVGSSSVTVTKYDDTEGDPPVADTWYHVRLVITSDNVDLYVDGELRISAQSPMPNAGVGITCRLQKIAGADVRLAYLDYMRVRQSFDARFID